MPDDETPPFAPPGETAALHAPQAIFTPPDVGELITSSSTGNTYRIGAVIGEGAFGVVYECIDTWENELAVKVLKPRGTYEQVRDSAIAELEKLPTDEQERIGRWLKEELASERAWDSLFEGSADSLGRLAEEARADLAAGRATRLDPEQM